MKNEPEIITSLYKYKVIISKISTIGIEVLPNTDKTHKTASIFIKKYKLMSNDAINAALSKEYKIEDIATNDGDFDRVDFMNVWNP